MDTCPACHFTYGALARPELISQVAAGGRVYAARLRTGDPALGRRPSADAWSPLEYACHVRDVLLMQRDRLYVALVEDDPSFKPMYRDQRVAFDRYDQQDPAEVADQVRMAADLFSHAYAGLSADQWSRPLVYGFPEPTRQDVEWVGHHTLHEMVHHLGDIDRGLGRA